MRSAPTPDTNKQGRRNQETAVLGAIAEAWNRASSVRQALEETLALVAGQLGLRTGWVWLLDTETGQFYSAAALNLPPYLREPVRMTGHACWCIDRFRAGKLAAQNVDVMECSRLRAAIEANAAEETAGLRAHASIPLTFQGRPLGIMNATAPSGRRFTAGELRFLSSVAYQVGIAIERARLSEERAHLTRSEERARLAREIHDTLAQDLTAIALHLESALTHLRAHPDRARERIERALATTRASLEEARRSVLDLRGAPPGGRPLPQALEALGRAFTTETGVRVRSLLYDPRSCAGALPARIEAELFRIAGEALANVRRHANAAEVILSLQLTSRTVRLVVHDSGRGCDFDAVPPERQGIVGMRERAALLGGRLRLRSRLGHGTTVIAEIPRLMEEAP
jgi:two-component system NarL family sensor kinase